MTTKTRQEMINYIRENMKTYSLKWLNNSPKQNIEPLYNELKELKENK